MIPKDKYEKKKGRIKNLSRKRNGRNGFEQWLWIVAKRQQWKMKLCNNGNNNRCLNKLNYYTLYLIYNIHAWYVCA